MTKDDIFNFYDMQKYGQLFGSCSNDYLFAFDFTKDVITISEKACERFFLPENEFSHVSATFQDFVYVEDCPLLATEVADLIYGIKSEHQLRYRLLDKQKNPVWVEGRGVIIRDSAYGNIRYLVGAINELGSKQCADPVTGILSIEAFREDWVNINPESKGFLLRIDIDEFKVINERLGSDYGDMVIKNLAACIQQAIHPVEQVYHLFADEFMIINHNSGTKEQGIALYKSIRSAIDEIIEANNYEAVYTLSAGLLEFDEKNHYNFNRLLQKTQFSLIHAKELGKNQIYIYQEEDFNHFLREQMIISELRESLRHNYRGFETYFQPLVSEPDEQIYAAETLLRFTTKDGERISPGEFIPLLETTGLIIPVGRLVMFKAMQMCKECQKTYKDFKISINFSYIQLLKSSVFTILNQLLDEFELRPEDIIIELTESGYLDNSSTMQNIWNKLREKGYLIAIDDFGTGYSNIKNIGDLRPNIVKVDRTLVVQALKNEYDHKVLEYIIDMIHSLKLHIVIEGIETIEEKNRINPLNPDYIQGYYYSKPCDSETFKQKYNIQ